MAFKKQTDASAQSAKLEVKEVPAKGASTSETWNAHWSIGRRLLEARRNLRGTQLWQQFQLDKNFDAFSIHVLARGVEEVLCDVGLISSFHVTRWQKEGNTSVVEGILRFEDVDSGQTRDYPAVGEAVDDSDKGFGKAISYARKMGMVSALNLGIGIDNEASKQAANTQRAAGPSMGGAPQQTAEATQANGAAANAFLSKVYTLQQTGQKARGVLGKDLFNNCWPIFSNSPTVSSLDAWAELNKEMLDTFDGELPAESEKLSKLLQGRRATLTDKGAL